MRTHSFIMVFIIAVLFGLFIARPAQSQDKDRKNRPDIRWDVHKELDENGNITRYDSTYSFRWSFPYSHEFDLDSLLESYDFHFPDLFDDYFFNEPFLPHSFSPPRFRSDPFPDLFYSPDSLFTRPFKHPFFDNPDFRDFFEWGPGYNDSTHTWRFKDHHFPHTFPDIREYTEEYQKLIEKYFNHPFYNDSIPGIRPNRYKNPGHQKKFSKELEI